MVTAGKVRWLIVFALLAASGVAGYVWWNRSPAVRDDAPADPRLTAETPFRNVRPGIEYAGDSACAACHASIDESYHHHPMGRSASTIAGDPTSQQFHVPALGQIELEGTSLHGKITHTETIKAAGAVLQTPAEIVATIGSGTRGKSYLCNREGSLWQSGASWFSAQPGWDASPGFWPGRHARRIVITECLFCHVNRVEPEPGAINRYREPLFGDQLSIGCERCHGPGALHVAERSADPKKDGRMDTSIVNPKHLPPGPREDICRQCHLQGEVRLVRRGREPFDYRPGLPLDEFISVYLPHPQTTDFSKSVGQIEQLTQSRCETMSAGKLGCVSCHDPHLSPAPAKRDEHYGNACLKCHQDKGCNLPEPQRREKNDSCVACHMPRSASSNIVHAAVTDHRILRRPSPAKPAKPSPPPGELPIVMLGKPAQWPAEAERARDLAVAISQLTKVSPTVLRETAERLVRATTDHPADVEAWEALATVRYLLGDPQEAFKAAESAVRLQPKREKALAKAAEMGLNAGQAAKAGEYARQAMRLSPGHPEHRLRLAQAWLDQGDAKRAEQELQVLLATLPNHAMARATLAAALQKQGRGREAMTELDRATAIYPTDNKEIRNWFTARIK